jgi:hypothetical protein
MPGGTCRRSADDAVAKLQLDAKMAIYGYFNFRRRLIEAACSRIGRKPKEIQDRTRRARRYIIQRIN